MTETNRSLDELPALIAERKKFEGWISALEGRRDATASHVFDRVRADYMARLNEVEDRLAAHRSAILEEKTNLESRRSLLEAEEQMRRDERAELELRAHVGELMGEDSESAFGTVDEALAKMGLERGGLSTRIDELDGYLTMPNRPDTPAGSATPAAPAGQTSMQLNGVGAASQSPSVPTPARSATPAIPSQPLAGTPQAGTPQSGTPVNVNKLVLSEHSATFQRTSGQMPDIDEVLAEPVSERHATPGPGKGQRLTPGGRFDELAFLSDVVGLKPDPNASSSATGAASTSNAASAAPVTSQPSREEQSSKSPLDGMAPSRPSNATPPLASNVGNTPISLRASGAISQSKTLKCTECGAMNYPTEWYCERCGAELAAL
ncbi:MAG TPA: hypothetical protein VGM82_19010 [Gemmatimonadaceae bacterium]